MRTSAINPLHAATLIILLIIGGLFWHSQRLKENYDAAATAYLQRALTDIGSWQTAALRRHFAEETNAAVTDAQAQALVERYRELGPFARLDNVQFTRLTAMLSVFSGKTLLSYSAEAHFQRGSAHLTATLVLRNGNFQFYNFNLGSPALAAPQP